MSCTDSVPKVALNCKLDFAHYPFDRQECPFIVTTMGDVSNAHHFITDRVLESPEFASQMPIQYKISYRGLREKQGRSYSIDASPEFVL